MFQNAHAEQQMFMRHRHHMEKLASQVDVKTVNDSFNSANDVFGGFREFSSDLFFQIINWITPMLENLKIS